MEDGAGQELASRVFYWSVCILLTMITFGRVALVYSESKPEDNKEKYNPTREYSGSGDAIQITFDGGGSAIHLVADTGGIEIAAGKIKLDKDI